MTKNAILTVLREKFPDARFIADEALAEGVLVEAKDVHASLALLRDEPALAFDFLNFITAVDRGASLDLVYFVSSYTHGHKLALKTRLENGSLSIETVSDLYKSADWLEREVYDLFGVAFAGHPDLRRIMLPDDWEGHPMRKDYTHENLIRKPDQETESPC